MGAAKLLIAAALAGVAAPALAQPTPAPVTVSVTARGETVPVGTAAADAADDPAIWRNRRNASASLIVATDKKAGLYVYGLDGKPRHFVPAGRLNNVDLVDLGRQGVIVVASDRNDEARAVLRLFRLDTQSGHLTALGEAPGGAGEAYGVCLLRARDALYAFSVLKAGDIHQVRLEVSANSASGAIVRSLKLATQAEGCVADARTGTLYVGEEDVGIWAFDAGAQGPVGGRLVAPADGAHLVADVEGLALAPTGRRGGWLVASSQGDSAYALYALPDLRPAGRFRVVAGTLGATEETDGIDLALGSFGKQYPGGLLVVQDGQNAPAAQNFKLIAWRDVLKALKAAGAK